MPSTSAILEPIFVEFIAVKISIMVQFHGWQLAVALVILHSSLNLVTGDQKSKNRVTEAEKQKASLYAYLGRSCDFKKWDDLMPRFWDAFFKPSETKLEDTVFSYQFPDVLVEFPGTSTQVSITRYLDRWKAESSNLTTYTVYKAQQRKEEEERCMSGGLLVCDKTSSKCVCMNKKEWVESEPGDIESGKSNSAGSACFIKTGTRCTRKTYSQGIQELPCLNLGPCNKERDMCDGVGRGKNQLFKLKMIFGYYIIWMLI